MLATASTEAVRAEESVRTAFGRLQNLRATQRRQSLMAFVFGPERTLVLGRSGR